MILIEAILSGIWATFFMDSMAKILTRRGLIHPFINPEAIGRWFLYMCKGKFAHEDINLTPALKNERTWSHISHNLIGIVLAGIYSLLAINHHGVGENVWMSLVYGIITVVLPWFWLLPSIGLGVMAKKSTRRNLILRTSFINHTNFGVGLSVWYLVFHRFFL